MTGSAFKRWTLYGGPEVKEQREGVWGRERGSPVRSGEGWRIFLRGLFSFLNRSWGCLGPSWAVLVALGSLLGRSWLSWSFLGQSLIGLGRS